MKTYFKKLLFAGIFAAFFSCDTEESLPFVDDQVDVGISYSVNDPKLLSFLKENQMESESILELGEGYLVGGDIYLSKESLKNDGYNYGWIKNKEKLHATYSLVSSTPFTYKTIRIKFSSNIPTTSTYLNWRSATAVAILEYNNVRNLRLKFEIVDSGSYDILITTENPPSAPNGLPYNVIASGDWPSFGNPGGKVYINPNYSYQSSVTESIKKYNMIHELGHNIGYRHTNYQAIGESSNNATYVPGTYPDASSVMNGGTAGFSWNGFSFLDLVAFRTNYPYDNTEKPFFAYKTNYGGQGGWTTNWSVYGGGTTNYLYEGAINGYIYTSAKTGTIPLYMYKDLNTNLEYMSTNPNLSSTAPNFTRLSTIGHVYNSSGANRIPVYEYFNYTTGYYFTILTNDPKVTGSGWIGGGAAFYAVTLAQ